LFLSEDTTRSEIPSFSAISLLDQDSWQQREFGLEAELDGHRFAFRVPAAKFQRMGWVLKHLGPQAIVYPGQQQHARAAIQWLSGPIRQERIFGHLGWSKQGPDWVYLQPVGSFGAQGPRRDIHVEPPAGLELYSVRPPEPTARAHLVRASLRFLSLAPDRISFPLLAAVYRAPLGNVDFSVFLTGRTGTFKTALAALCQSALRGLQSRIRDAQQISRGKFDRLPHATAEFTTSAFDG
jgi:hypothetical protein